MKIRSSRVAAFAMAAAMTFMTVSTFASGTKAGHDRPIVAVIGGGSMTEVTDFIVPYAVLAESGAAEVIALGTQPGALRMWPALAIQPHETVATFDVRHPEGADYVIVPAVRDRTDPALLEWVRGQAAKGATMVSICDGLWVLANAGLLEGKRVTGHWFSRDAMRRNHPGAQWIDDQRYVVDGNIMTTTGISASIPASLALVESIAGRQRALEVAASFGVTDWSPAHESRPFRITGKSLLTLTANKLAFWSHEKVAIPVADGVDELALALTADGYSRTYRSAAFSVAASAGPVTTRRGLVLLPDATGGADSSWVREAVIPKGQGSDNALDLVLRDIGSIYGARTEDIVALQLEHPRR
jgi:putative intracellular protease/amidase